MTRTFDSDEERYLVIVELERETDRGPLWQAVQGLVEVDVHGVPDDLFETLDANDT